ncbi:hypothetical protein AB0F72_27590 [Actinoplanes sp. NPDC023936]|uniref:GNAT family N-acetyltransferase n=1 Tax=Actinoplanes sp. NPDC023936 TaxID=3154910 RepID=UPI0033E82DC1
MSVKSAMAVGAVDAMAAAMEWLAQATPGGLAMRGRDGAVLAVTGARVPMLNGITTTAETPDADAIAELATLVPDGIPWSIATRREPSGAVREVARQHGLTRQISVPLMVRGRDPLPGLMPVGGRIRLVGADEVPVAAGVIAAGFEAPPEVFGAMLTAPVLTGAGAQTYLLTKDGMPASTGLSLRQGKRFGLFNIATPPEHRRRGFAYAVTQRMLLDGFLAGADYAYLQASKSGRPLYEELGFRTVENWTYLVPE